MKKMIALASALLIGGMMNASAQEENIVTLTPTYLDGVLADNAWKGNWFVAAQGGLSAFSGRPLGHGDLFDRTKPMASFAVGKWLKPSVGLRLMLQGFKTTDANSVGINYQNIHADLLYNVSSLLFANGQSRWTISPYAGIGLIHNDENGQKPFAVSYGINAQYNLTQRIALSADLGATTTWQDFDGRGSSSRLGDHLLQASIGITYTIGQVGWQRVIDPKPFIAQNNILRKKNNTLNERIYSLQRQHDRDKMAMMEMRKIIEIEGLLEKYCLTQTDTITRPLPRNNYSGLNALRSRLRNKNWNGDTDNYSPVLANGDSSSITGNDDGDTVRVNTQDYITLVRNRQTNIGAPILFFFRLGTSTLIDPSQTANAKEIAKVMLRYNLTAQITGRADRATGTADGNKRLSADRAAYVASLLKAYGVHQEDIKIQYAGGVDTYSPAESNRNTSVMLYMK